MKAYKRLIELADNLGPWVTLNGMDISEKEIRTDGFKITNKDLIKFLTSTCYDIIIEEQNVTLIKFTKNKFNILPHFSAMVWDLNENLIKHMLEIISRVFSEWQGENKRVVLSHRAKKIYANIFMDPTH